MMRKEKLWVFFIREITKRGRGESDVLKND